MEHEQCILLCERVRDTGADNTTDADDARAHEDIVSSRVLQRQSTDIH
jgi:hypothetical protein